MADATGISFQVATVAGLVGMGGYYGSLSIRRKHIQPGLWLALGCLSIFWMEAPYDSAMYAEFRPGIARFGHVGPLGATYQGLPWLAVPGYVLYFGVPTVIALALAPRITRRFDLTRPVALLATGLAVGVIWDATFEIIGTQVGLWRFARTNPGLTLFPGTPQQVPVYCFLAMGITIMVATYITGRVTDNGTTLIEVWATRFKPGATRIFATGFGFIAILHLVYFMTFAPHLMTKLAGWQTTKSDHNLFHGILLQPK